MALSWQTERRVHSAQGPGGTSCNLLSFPVEKLLQSFLSGEGRGPWVGCSERASQRERELQSCTSSKSVSGLTHSGLGKEVGLHGRRASTCSVTQETSTEAQVLTGEGPAWTAQPCPEAWSEEK